MTIISVAELQRRITVFIRTLPNNPTDGKPWTIVEISRVMLHHTPQRVFNPSAINDKIDLHHLLRFQHYNDIKLAVNLKVAKLQRETRQYRQAGIQ